MYDHRDPIVRSSLYKLLSIGFRYPTPEIFKIFQNGEFLDVMKGMTFVDLEIQFTRTFDAGNPVPPCPPYEGLYCGKPRSMVMLEVSEFYNCFGLRMSQEGGKREFPDHISAELEFLHFLAFKEAQAMETGDEEKHKGYLLAQKDFLERHLSRWVPEFCLRVQNSAGAPFYDLLARITSRFIKKSHLLLELLSF